MPPVLPATGEQSMRIIKLGTSGKLDRYVRLVGENAADKLTGENKHNPAVLDLLLAGLAARRQDRPDPLKDR